MRLDSLLAGLDARILGDPATPISELYYDSRQVKPGGLFVALRGTQTDGHRFIAQALEAGAVAVIAEELPDSTDVCGARVPDSRAALAELAARLLGRPAADMTLIGVTGTNGKTSTVRMIESILAQAGHAVGSIGTISVRYPGHEEPAHLTTPESLDLQRILARMRDAGVDTTVLEISSHALALGRVRTLRFGVAVYTNLSQDHLDFHTDMESYAATKARLFGPDSLAGPAILNHGDPQTPRLRERVQSHGQRVLSFGRGEGCGADVRGFDERAGSTGSRWVVETRTARREIQLPLPGDFQIDNALAAIATACALDVPWPSIVAGLASCPPIPGRLERVADLLPAVFVDYAHTPEALARVLGRMRPWVRERLITVFGCGGDRDRSKRVPMAEAAQRGSDHVVATTDNPRTEDPQAILREVAQGLTGSHEVIVDRREAIRHAIRMASPGDVVLIAGKGHEDTQLVGSQRLPFDDRAEALQALQERGSKQ